MLAGQIIYGLGGGIIVTFQEAILSRWFHDKQLAVVVGFLLCVARLSKFLAKLICYPLVNAAGGDYITPITVTCGISVLANIVYYMTMVKAGYCTVSGREIIRPNSCGYHTLVDNRFKYGIMLYIPSIFWMIPWLQISMSSALSSFGDVSTEYIQFRFTTSSITAGYTSSLTQAVLVIAAPRLGSYIHKYGQRLYILIIGTIILILALVLLAYTWVTPEVGMILVSLSFCPIALLSSTSFLLLTELAGIGVWLHKCGNNIGTTLFAIIVNYIQDLMYHDGDSADNKTDLVSEYE